MFIYYLLYWQIVFYNANLMSITLICTLLSLFPVLQRSVRHHRPVWQEDHEHADVVLWRSTRVLRHAQLPHRYQQPVCDPAETWAPGRSDRPCRALQVDQVRLHVQLGLRLAFYPANVPFQKHNNGN